MVYWNKIKVHIGKINYYLGMYLDYSETGLVNFSIIKYLQKVLDEFTQELIGTSATPATDHMFQVSGEDKAEFLEEYRSDTFHQSVAKSIFMRS